MATFPTDQIPSRSTRARRENRLHKARFGDGYVQRAKNGINPNPQVWDVVFLEEHADITTIDNFLVNNFAILFDWTPPAPFDTSIKVACEQWDWIYEDGLVIGLRAMFEQEFNP